MLPGFFLKKCSRGADFRLRDTAGRTAMDVAANEEVSLFLQAYSYTTFLPSPIKDPAPSFPYVFALHRIPFIDVSKHTENPSTDLFELVPKGVSCQDLNLRRTKGHNRSRRMILDFETYKRMFQEEDKENREWNLDCSMDSDKLPSPLLSSISQPTADNARQYFNHDVKYQMRFSPYTYWEPAPSISSSPSTSLAYVLPGSDEYDMIRAHFINSSFNHKSSDRKHVRPFKMLSVFRVQDGRRESLNRQVREMIFSDRLDESKLCLDERLLWHGPKNIGGLYGIINKSTKVVYCGRGIWGKGTYFSTNPNYVDDGYTFPVYSEVDEREVRCMFLCHVVLGDYVSGKSMYVLDIFFLVCVCLS